MPKCCLFPCIFFLRRIDYALEENILTEQMWFLLFTWENSHQREFHTRMTFWFRIAFTWWLGHLISRYLKVHFMFIKYMWDWKSQTLRMRYPFQSSGSPISHRNAGGRFAFTWFRSEISYWSEILAPVQEPGWAHALVTRAGMKFCGGIMKTNIKPWEGTGVNSLRGESRPGFM